MDLGRCVQLVQRIFDLGLLGSEGHVDLAEVDADTVACLLDCAGIAGAGVVVADAQHGQRRANAGARAQGGEIVLERRANLFGECAAVQQFGAHRETSSAASMACLAVR